MCVSWEATGHHKPHSLGGLFGLSPVRINVLTDWGKQKRSCTLNEERGAGICRHLDATIAAVYPTKVQVVFTEALAIKRKERILVGWLPVTFGRPDRKGLEGLIRRLLGFEEAVIGKEKKPSLKLYFIYS